MFYQLSSTTITPLESDAGKMRAPELPLEDFFRNEESLRYRLSQQGTWISWLEPWQGRRNIFVKPAAGGNPVRVTSVTERDISTYFWSGDNELLYLMDTGGYENFRLFSQ